MSVFKDRYVLAEGYPWGIGFPTAVTSVRMDKTARMGGVVLLGWPEELWRDDIPRYRLVLERIKPLRKASKP